MNPASPRRCNLADPRLLLLAALALLLPPTAARSASASAAADPPATSVTATLQPAAAQPAAPDTPHQRLQELFTASDEANLERNPLEALFRGDRRYAARFGDYLSDAYFAAEKRAVEDDLAALANIDRATLDPADRISYDVFRYSRELDRRGYEPTILAATVVRPIDHFTGAQTFVPQIASGEGIAPFDSVADYDDNLARLEGYIAHLDAAIVRMREGLAAGITQPKLVVRNVIEQLDNLLAEGVEGSTFYKPITKFPDAVPAAERRRLTAAYARFIRERLDPAHERLRSFLRDDYLPHARDSVGLAQMPGGTALYRYLIARMTTTELSAEAIHRIGLDEVARIAAGMDRVREQVGFKGSRREFAHYLSSDPRFVPKSREAMAEAFLEIDRRVRAVVGREFAHVPRSPLSIRPVPTFKERTAAAGSYQNGTPDGSRPGVFYYNAYDLPARPTWGFETLFLHEAIPGHHYQIMLAIENAALPPFQRFGGNTAYVEGWALYTESLGATFGLFTDPYQLYGHYNDEMLRAMRLVVDTGIHALGWSRDQAIAYMLDNSAMSRTDATAEVERYIAMPAQALAYKLGQLTISRLRSEAEQALGARFDPREFHSQVLDSGALPLSVLEDKIHDWFQEPAHTPAEQ
ncbi:MAG: DUF885 domain-containing protein [Sinobacteraceae bacterium]|nr:DUF885 domain-containing protein [Nevskiaceae bacterium]MCP5466871.1 DUF885 domain-containing protein [Nevskiaceae bacterium]